MGSRLGLRACYFALPVAGVERCRLLRSSLFHLFQSRPAGERVSLCQSRPARSGLAWSAQRSSCFTFWPGSTGAATLLVRLRDMAAETHPEPADTGVSTGVSGEVSGDPADTGAVGGPTLTLAEAVKRCGVSRATLQRRLKAGAIAGAERVPGGGWSIPVAGLVAAGLTPAATPAEHPDPVPAAAGSQAELDQLRAELVRLRTERDHQRELAATYRDQADRLLATVESLARALPPAGGTSASRRRWWSRSRPASSAET